MMDVEVLVSCMNQSDMSIARKLNIQGNAVIVNQCDRDGYSEERTCKGKIRMILSRQKGLTRSRNLALANASGDICILCDDDVCYIDDYEEKILEAFRELPDADIIVFDIERVNHGDGNIAPIPRIRRAPFFKSYGSVRIAFRLKSIQQNNIWFDVNFGAGSVYTSGEETIFLMEARRKGLNIYEYPLVIAKVDFSESTWRQGYGERFFYDKGALLSAAFPRLKYIFIFYYVLKFWNSASVSKCAMVAWLIRGIIGYRSLRAYSASLSDQNRTNSNE